MLDKNNVHDVYLALGSNIGDKEANMHRAAQQIDERIGEIISLSVFYVTFPVGFESDNSFLNAACHIRTKLHPLEILQTTQVIELEMGRNLKSHKMIYTDRVIDIDLLLFDDQCFEYPHLVLPHPHMHERLFVLEPMSEIAGDVRHPILKKTMQELFHALV